MQKNYFNRLLKLNFLTSVHCTLSYIALSLMFGYIFSNSIFFFTLFTGIYLIAMGFGVIGVERIYLSREKWISMIFINCLLGIFLANPGIPFLMILNEYLLFYLRSREIDGLFVMLPLGIILTLSIGMVSGAEFPIFSKLAESDKDDTPKTLISVLKTDYFGAFLGIVLFTFILNPFFGLIKSIIISQVASLIYINMSYFSRLNTSRSYPLTVFLLIMDAYVCISWIMSQPLIDFINAISSW